MSPGKWLNHRWHPVIPVLIVALGVGLSFLVFEKARVADETSARSVLELRAEWRARDFQDKMTDATNSVEALAMFMGSSTKVDPAAFGRFASRADPEDPIARLLWAPRISAAERPAFEAAARADGLADYRLLEQMPDGAFDTAAQRVEHLPVRLEASFDDGPSLLGFDFLSEPVLQVAADEARDSAKPIATPVKPATSQLRSPTYIVFWPVYRDRPASVAERRATLIGYATGTFHFESILPFALKNTPDVTETLSLFIDHRPGQPYDTPLVVYRPDPQTVERGNAPLAGPAPGGIRLTRSFEEYGRLWTLVFDVPPSEVAMLQTSTRWGYLAFGLLVTVLIGGYVAVEQRRRTLVEATVADRTRELRQTSDQLKGIIEASPFAIVCLDAARNVIVWNRAAVRIFGYASNDVIGRRNPIVPVNRPDELEPRIARIARGEILHDFESLRPRKDGTLVLTSTAAAGFSDAHGTLQGIIFTIEDVTERNQVQQQLRQAQKMEAVGQLTGGLAHDFNNLIGIILGNLDMVSEEIEASSPHKEMLDAAIQAATRGAELTRQLLAFSRRQPLAPKLTDLPVVVDGIVQLLRRTLGESITLELKMSDTAWPVLIDVSQLESAILNLSVNARDAMPNGGRLTIETKNVTLDDGHAELNPEASAGDYVVIAVSDTGVGMSPDVIAHVFEPFFTTKGAKGTGLGLSMVHGFVKQSGGHTKIYSEPGHGTTIRIYLPRASMGESAAAEPSVRAIEQGGNEVILVVEDNKGMRDIALRQLQSLGYRTISASDGNQALELLRGGVPVDLLFTDMVMPGGIDGRMLAEAARTMRPGLKVLFTSGFTAAAASAAMADEFGVNLLSKPYRKEELSRRIRAVLDSLKEQSA